MAIAMQYELNHKLIYSHLVFSEQASKQTKVSIARLLNGDPNSLLMENLSLATISVANGCTAGPTWLAVSAKSARLVSPLVLFV